MSKEDQILIAVVLVDIFISLVRLVKNRKRVYYLRPRLTKLEKEIMIDAIDTYQAVIVRKPEAFKYPLEQVADYVHELDILKDKIENV